MKKEYAEEVAAKLIEQLEQGAAPWQKPWQPGELTLPYNGQTGKEYRGMNSMWLAMQGHSDPRWMTYNQAADVGAQVRKGSKGTKIIYWKFREEQQAKDEQGRPIRDEDGKPKMVTVELERPRAFHAVVFNAEQIDGLPPLQPKQRGPEPERHARAEAILFNSGANIQHIEGDRAFYRPSTDSITLPERHQFQSADNYYATALHELGHWTGHPSRLDRDLAHPFGSEGYAREELRAEIASLMLGERMDIGHDPGQHAAYVGSWIKALKEDPREIFRAAADAERIAGYVMGFEQEKLVERKPAQQANDLTTSQDQGVPVPATWRYAACEAFDKEMAVRMSNPNYSKARELAHALNEYDEMGFEPSSREQAILAERKPAMDEAAQWIHHNVLLNPVVKERVYEKVRDLGRYTGDAGDDKERREYLAEMEGKQRAQRVGLDAERTPSRLVLHEQPEEPMVDRTYLAVPFREKDEAKAAAKAAGFKLGWDGNSKAWYAPIGVDLAASGLARWKVDNANVVNSIEPNSPIDQFYDALHDAGLVVKTGDVPTSGDQVGKIQRVPVVGDKVGATSGAYAYHIDGKMPGGFIQNYKTGERVNWKAEGRVERVSPEDRARLVAENAQRQQRRNSDIQARYDATAKAAAALWSESPAATSENAYCATKGIENPGEMGLRVVPDAASPQAAALGIKIAKTAREAKDLRNADPNARVFKAGDLLVPGYDDKGKLWTLQSVNPYFKSFMKGGRKHGLFTVAGANPDGKPVAELLANKDVPLLLAEGYATGDTVAKLSGQPVIVAFDSGNLNAVAGTLREKFPQRTMLIAADNDYNASKGLGSDGKPRVNIGLEKAKETAEKHGAGVAAPQFKAGEKASDWNDMRAMKGDEEARKLLAEQLAIAKRDAAIISERLITLARTRDMEARNDPTTSADDAEVAAERGKAASMIVSAAEQNSQVRSASADGMLGGKGARSSTAARAGIERKTETLRDTAKRERQDVLSPAVEKEAKEKEQAAKQSRQRRSRGIDVSL